MQFAKSIRDAAETGEDNRDIATANQLEDILNNVERYKWFLFEVLQGVDNTS